MLGPNWTPSGRVRHAPGCRIPAFRRCGRPCRSANAVSLVVAEAARKPVVVQRLTVTPSLFFATKFASRSSFISRAMRSSASSQETRSNLSEPGLRTIGYFSARLGLDEVEQRRALRAQRAAIGRMVGVALDMDDLGLLALLQVALRVHDDAAGDRAVGAGVAGFGGVGELESADRLRHGRLRSRRSQRRQAPYPQHPRRSPSRNWRRESSMFIACYLPLNRLCR